MESAQDQSTTPLTATMNDVVNEASRVTGTLDTELVRRALIVHEKTLEAIMKACFNDNVALAAQLNKKYEHMVDVLYSAASSAAELPLASSSGDIEALKLLLAKEETTISLYNKEEESRQTHAVLRTAEHITDLPSEMKTLFHDASKYYEDNHPDISKVVEFMVEHYRHPITDDVIATQQIDKVPIAESVVEQDTVYDDTPLINQYNVSANWIPNAETNTHIELPLEFVATPRAPCRKRLASAALDVWNKTWIKACTEDDRAILVQLDITRDTILEKHEAVRSHVNRLWIASIAGGDTKLTAYLRRELDIIDTVRDKFDCIPAITDGIPTDQLMESFKRLDHDNWSEVELNEMRQEYSDGKTVNDIAEIHYRSLEDTMIRLFRLGVVLPSENVMARL